MMNLCKRLPVGQRLIDRIADTSAALLGRVNREHAAKTLTRQAPVFLLHRRTIGFILVKPPHRREKLYSGSQEVGDKLLRPGDAAIVTQ